MGNFYDESLVGENSCGDPTYALFNLREKYEVVDIDSNNWLVIDNKDGWINAAHFEFSSSDMNDENIEVCIVYTTSGTGEPLGEMRHTYWGPDLKGYTFYLPVDAVCKSLQYLRKHYFVEE